MANPDGASAEKGAAVMERIVDFVASFVDCFRAADVRTASPAVDHYVS